MAQEWTDALKLDFLRTFFRDADASFSNSPRSGLNAKYEEWCRKHGIESGNAHGGYSFYGKLDDVIFEYSDPDVISCTFYLTERGKELMKQDLATTR